MIKLRISHVLFWALAAVAAVLLGFFVALLAGALPVGDPGPPPDTSAFEALETAPAEEQQPATVTKRVRTTSPTVRTTTPTTAKVATPPPTPVAVIVVTAARGDCWISARLGSEDGPLIDERLLAQGQSVTLRGARVWLSAGAAANVDVTVDGKARELQSGTVAVVLGPA